MPKICYKILILNLNFDTDEENDTEKGASSKATASTPTTPTTAPHDGETSNSTQSQTRSSALQVTRELHAQIMSKVRDLAPTINNTKPTNTTKLTIPSNPPTPTGSTQTTDPVSNHQANTSTPNSPSAAANKSQSVMELQNVLSQYVQRHLANAQSSTSPAPRSNPPTPRGSSTPTTSTPNPSNQPRGTIPASLIANKLMLAANSTLQHNMHNPKDPRDKSQNGTGNDASNRAPTTFASKRTAARSMLDNSVPVMSVQYKQQKHEKRQGTASYHSDEVVDDDGSNYFLNAAHHELQNMEDELAFSENILWIVDYFI